MNTPTLIDAIEAIRDIEAHDCDWGDHEYQVGYFAGQHSALDNVVDLLETMQKQHIASRVENHNHYMHNRARMNHSFFIQGQPAPIDLT